MKLTKQEKQILIEIFKASNGLFLFTLHRQLNLSPKEIYSAIENLKSYGLLELKEDKVTITKDGVGYSVQTPLKTKTDITSKKLMKEDFLGRRININEFYIPQNFEK
jgi:hypothetical protein